MGLIIGENQTNILNFENKGLTSKEVRAVADAISKYKFKVETVNCSDNQLKDLDCKILVESLSNQYKNLRNLSFNKNKIGSSGLNALLNVYDKFKSLEYLDLSENILSDYSVLELFDRIEKYGSKLRQLKLSRNFIGKTVHAQKMVDAFVSYVISTNCNLELLDMSWNNIGGKIGKTLLKTLSDCHTMREFSFAYNLFGLNAVVKGKPEEAPILELSEVLLKSSSIEICDFSYNSIDSFGIYCISYGLERSTTLKSINLVGNPIGAIGYKYLVNAVYENPNKQFKDFFVDNSLTGGLTTSLIPSYEITLKEGDYAFNLALAFDRLKLRKLLDLDLAAHKEVPDSDSMQFIRQPRLDGKPWPLPRIEATWSWSWPIEQNKGILRMNFSLKLPKQLKINSADVLGKIKKETQSEKRIINESDFSKLKKLADDYQKKNKEDSQVDIIIGLAEKNKFWSYQAKEALASLKSLNSVKEVIPYLVFSIMDRLMMHTIFDGMNKTMIDNIINCKPMIIDFTPLNLNGHYRIDLSNSTELYSIMSNYRSIMEGLLEMNKNIVKLMEKNRLYDRSMHGNKCCFRNESLQLPLNSADSALAKDFIITKDWKILKEGVLTFDFVCLYLSRNQTPMTPEQFDNFLEIFNSDKCSIEEKIRMFKLISEYIWITSDQLKRVLELHDGTDYKRDIYIYGMGRITDIENYDFIKTSIKPGEEKVLRDLYKRVGVLNLFNPQHPDGNYSFDLKVYEEKAMLNILCELAKKEGDTCIQNVVQDKKTIKDIPTFIKDPPKEGIVELTYIRPEDKDTSEIEKAIGKRYLSWEVNIDFSVIPELNKS